MTSCHGTRGSLVSCSKDHIADDSVTAEELPGHTVI